MTTTSEIYTISAPTSSLTFRNILGMPIQKRIIAGVIIVFALFTAFIIGFILMKNSATKSKSTITFANSFLNINPSVDPCSNFYQFTCGLWSKHHNSITNTKVVNAFTLLKDSVNKKRKDIFLSSELSLKLPRLVNDALKFYKHCTDFDRNNKLDNEYLLSILEEIGGWPILNNGIWNESAFNWRESSLFLMKQLDIEAFFGIHFTVDDRDSASSVVLITTSTPDNDYDLSDYFTKVLLLIVLQTINPEFDGESFTKDLDRLEKLESTLKNMISDTLVSDPIQLSFYDLEQHFPNFNWQKLIKTFLYDQPIDPEEKFKLDNMLMIENISYLKKAISVLLSNTFTKRDIANYYGWLVVKSSLNFLSDVLKNYADYYQEDEQELKAIQKETCFKKTLEIYECSIDYLYVQNNSDKGVIDSRVLVRYLKSAFRNAFINSSWLDDSTRNTAIRKLDSLQTILGYKDYHKNKSEFEKLYKDFPPVNENILQVYFKIKAFYIRLIINQFKSNDGIIIEDDLPRPITDVSAYYILQKNRLVVPISLFSPPFYYSHGPFYLNFGSLGSIIGHEIMHAFDKHGCHRDENGSLFNWWTTDSYLKYSALSDCFYSQYNSYYNSRNISETNLTLGENIADSEGVQAAFIAYKLWMNDSIEKWDYPVFQTYSSDQMFFISFGTLWCSTNHGSQHYIKSVHSIPEIRVNGAVSNSKYFSLAFNCPKNSEMNPVNKCKLW